MSRYKQRAPYHPKATWWKKLIGKSSLGKRVIYRATNELGFEIGGYPQQIQAVTLTNGAITADETIEYVDIVVTSTETTTDEDGNETPTESTTIKTLHFQGQYYVFNTETNELTIDDVADEDAEIIDAYASNVMRIEKNNYVLKHAFDCAKEDNQENVSYQPIQGLLTDASYLNIRTQSFCDSRDKPQHEDIIFYQGKFWIIEETSESFIYTPREKSILHLSLKLIKK